MVASQRRIRSRPSSACRRDRSRRANSLDSTCERGVMKMAKRITKIGRYRVEDGTRPYTSGEELSLRELAGYQRRAASTILREVKNIEPEVLKFSRKSIGLTQPQLAELLGVTAETVSRWENGSESFKPSVQLALAML